MSKVEATTHYVPIPKPFRSLHGGATRTWVINLDCGHLGTKDGGREPKPGDDHACKICDREHP